MELNTVIFDMDGLLIDSEPLWGKAAEAYFDEHNIRLTKQQYALTTGMRTKEFLQYWFTHFGLPGEALAEAEQRIVQHVVELVKKQGEPMPGAAYIVSNMSSISCDSAASNTVTGVARVRSRGSGNSRIERDVMFASTGAGERPIPGHCTRFRLANARELWAIVRSMYWGKSQGEQVDGQHP